MSQILAVSITVSANIVAWYGAILATLSAIATAYKFWLDRASLTVRCSSDIIGVTSTMKQAGGPYLQITISNRGRRPVRLGPVSVKLRKSLETNLLLDSMKRNTIELTEGSSHSELMNQTGLQIDQLGLVFMIDATGRHWVARARVNGDSKMYKNRIVVKWLKFWHG